MKFPELCERLIREVGAADVSSNAYVDLGSRSSEGLILWVHDGVYEVGFDERGGWSSDATFPTEEAACAFLYDKLTQRPKVRERTAEEIERSREINEAYSLMTKAEDEYRRLTGKHPPEQ